MTKPIIIGNTGVGMSYSTIRISEILSDIPDGSIIINAPLTEKEFREIMNKAEAVEDYLEIVKGRYHERIR